jgi:hypothetical protein
MPLTGEGERLPDPLQVHGADRVVGMLRDDGEQVGEQLLLMRQEVEADARDNRRRGRALTQPDSDVGIGRQVARSATRVEDRLAGARVAVTAF